MQFDVRRRDSCDRMTKQTRFTSSNREGDWAGRYERQAQVDDDERERARRGTEKERDAMDNRGGKSHLQAQCSCRPPQPAHAFRPQELARLQYIVSDRKRAPVGECLGQPVRMQYCFRHIRRMCIATGHALLCCKAPESDLPVVLAVEVGITLLLHFAEFFRLLKLSNKKTPIRTSLGMNLGTVSTCHCPQPLKQSKQTLIFLCSLKRHLRVTFCSMGNGNIFTDASIGSDKGIHNTLLPYICSLTSIMAIMAGKWQCGGRKGARRKEKRDSQSVLEEEVRPGFSGQQQTLGVGYRHLLDQIF